MPIANQRFTLGTGVITQIVAPDNQPQHVTVHEADHSESTSVLIGGSTLTTSNGLHIHSADTLSFEIGPEDALYATSTQGAPTLHVLTITKQD